MSKAKDVLEEIFDNHESLCSKKDGLLCTHCREAKQQILQTLHADLVELIPKDKTETRGLTQNPNNANNLTKGSKYYNQARAEILAIIEEYFEGEVK